MATAVNTVDEKAMTATEIERLKAMNLAGLKLYVSAVKSSGEAFKKYLDQASIFAKAFTNGGKDNLLKAVFTNTVDPVSIKDVKAAAKELAASLVEGPKATAKALVESASTALKGTAQSSGEDIKKGVEQAVREKVDDIKDQASALDPNKPSVTE